MVNLKSRDALHDRLRRELANCVKCGACMAFCPVYKIERSETANMRGRLALIQSLETGRKIPSDAVDSALSKCAGCLSCRSACPNKVETGLATVIGRYFYAAPGLRRTAWLWLKRILRRYPAGRDLLMDSETGGPARDGNARPIASLLKSLKQVIRNPARVRDLPGHGAPGVNPPESKQADILIIPGCHLALRHEAVHTAVRLLKRAGCGSARAFPSGCCGLPALVDGDLEGFAESVRSLFADIAKEAPARVLFLCPECWYAWRLIPELCDLDQDARTLWKLGDEFHAALAGSGWTPEHRMEGRFTLHEACLFARGGGDRQAPRRLLESCTASKPVDSFREGSCCGSQGGLRRFDPDLARRITSERIEELSESGADTVVTHCSRCRDTLAAGLGARGIRTETLLELLGEAGEE